MQLDIEIVCENILLLKKFNWQFKSYKKLDHIVIGKIELKI